MSASARERWIPRVLGYRQWVTGDRCGLPIVDSGTHPYTLLSPTWISSVVPQTHAHETASQHAASLIIDDRRPSKSSTAPSEAPGAPRAAGPSERRPARPLLICSSAARFGGRAESGFTGACLQPATLEAVRVLCFLTCDRWLQMRSGGACRCGARPARTRTWARATGRVQYAQMVASTGSYFCVM